MEYFISEVYGLSGTAKTAGVKAREDLDTIFRSRGIQPLVIPFLEEERIGGNALKKIVSHWKVGNIWRENLAKLQMGDTLIIQFPLIDHSIFQTGAFKSLKKKNVKTILFIHDLELLRNAKRSDVPFAKRIRLKIEEQNFLKQCDYVVAHNSSMAEFLPQLGIRREQILNLEIFDYLVKDADEERFAVQGAGKDDPVIIAGNLRKHKVEYAYKLPDSMPFNLYGVDYEGKQSDYIHYFGAFQPEELPYVMNGSFGLVWDGTSADTCQGVYGEYLRINNPHKTSLYISSGIPVVIWKEAALADFVQKNGCGIVVGSLKEISDVVSNLTADEYEAMKKKTMEMSRKLRSGYFTCKVLDQCR